MVARHALLRAWRLFAGRAGGFGGARPQARRAAPLGGGRVDCDRPGPASLWRQRSAAAGRRRRRVLTEAARCVFRRSSGALPGGAPLAGTALVWLGRGSQQDGVAII